jgi:dihydroxy-acid dehydratase
VGGPEALRHPDREAFENAIVVNSAIGGSTNAPIHINAIARHIGVEARHRRLGEIGYDVPLLVNMQPAGEYLGEEYPPRRRRAGGGQRTDEGRAASAKTR